MKKSYLTKEDFAILDEKLDFILRTVENVDGTPHQITEECDGIFNFLREITEKEDQS